MGHRKEEVLSGSDTSSDDEGHSVQEEGSDDETSSINSSITDDGGQAPGKEEEREVVSPVVEQAKSIGYRKAETRDEDDESAPVYNKFHVETSLKDDQKPLVKQESGNNYNVVVSETVDGIHNALENHDAAPPAPEKSEELAAAHEGEESTVSEEEREISDAAEGNGNGIHEAHEEAGKDVVAERAIEESLSTLGEVEANGVALEGETGATDLTPKKSARGGAVSDGQDEDSEDDVMISTGNEWLFAESFRKRPVTEVEQDSDDDEVPEEAVTESKVPEQGISGELESKNGQDNGEGESGVPEESAKDVIKEQAVKESSPTLGGVEANDIALEAATDLTPEKSEKDVVEEQAIEESSTVGEVEANGIALEGEPGATDLTPEESSEAENKSGQDNGGRQFARGLSVELGSPLELQKRYMRPFATPSPPKRENSVYKIVMALEGLQVGEKCIHGEIDHGTCHLRYSDRRMSGSPSSFSRHRETSTSPKEAGGDATSAEVKASSEEKTEVDSDWSFVQQDSQQSSTVKTETYTDHVVIRREDGFLPRTPGRSPLSGSQPMRAVFTQADASGSTTPRLKIIHDFPAERTDDAGAVDGESEVERILRLQETHDLVCPNCNACITKRVILRKRKRTTPAPSTDDTWVTEPVQDVDSEDSVVEPLGSTVVEQYEDYGCLGCFTFLFRRERSVQVPSTEDPAVLVATITPATEPVVVAPPAPTDADYDNRCLPIFFTWRRKTTSPADAEIVEPLLRPEEKDTLSEEEEVRDVPETPGPSEIQAPPPSEILELPAAPGGIQLPVVVVETREDRLCFPFLWRRASKTTTAQPEILQPLLDSEAITDDQLFPRDTKGKSEQQPGDDEFGDIGENLWFRREVLLEVPVSVPPQETPTTLEAVPESDTSLKTIRVTEAERKVDCLCFPSWSSSETTVSEENDSSRITDSSQAEPPAIPSKTTVDTPEIILSSPSLKDAILTPVAPSTDERATLNCMDVLLPSYPWGPPGTGSRKQTPEETATPTPFEFSAVDPEQVAQEKKPQEEIIKVSKSEPKGLSGTPNEISTMRTEDSRCLPISWRRQKAKTGEILDQSETGEIKSSVTSEPKSPETEVEPREFNFGDIEVSRSESGRERYRVPDDIEEEEDLEPLVRRPKSSEVEPLPSEEEEKPQVVAGTEVEGRDNLPPFFIWEDVHVTGAPELPRVTPEEPPREKAGWSCCLPKSVHVTVTPSLPPVDDVTVTPSLPSVGDVTVTPSLPSVDATRDEERRETESWSCCLPLYIRPTSRLTDREKAVSGGQASESDIHTEVTTESFIDARVTTQTTTTTWKPDATRGESIDSIQVDTSVSDIHASVQHDKGAVDGTFHLDDHASLSLHPAVEKGESQLVEDDEERTKISDGKEWLADSHGKHEPSKPVPEVENEAPISPGYVPRGEEIIGEAVTERKDVIPPADVGRTQAPVLDLQEDRSCCLPSSKWRWGRAKPSSDQDLTEPLLGPGDVYAEPQVSEETQPKVEQVPTVNATGVVFREDERCSCLPWRGRRDDLEAQLRERLLQEDPASEPLLHRDSESDSSARVTVEQVHEVTRTTTGPTGEPHLPDEERCNCFPWSTREQVDTTVTVTTDDTVIQVDGGDTADTLAAATTAATNAGMMDAHSSDSPELLKSIVYGGLDVTLTSLGVVASAAGGDAKTRNILALGLANLIFGFIAFFNKIQDMHKESPARFQQSVGPRFWINGPLAMLSFLFFGALPVLVFGFSFRELNDYDYKMGAVVLATTIAIVFLGCGKVASKMTELSYRRTLTTLITTGIVAAVAGFYTGDFISKLLAKYGILDE